MKSLKPADMTITQKILHLVLLVFAGSLSYTGMAQKALPAGHGHNHDHGNDLAFVENDGQWNEKVAFKAPLGGLNTLFLEKKGFTYLFHDKEDSEGLHDHMQKNDRQAPYWVKSHAYRVQFIGANEVLPQGRDKRAEYHNYILGNDESKWASDVGLFNKVVYPEVYPGINLEAYDVDGHFKYDFIVQPGANYKEIQLNYEGVDGMEIKNEQLLIFTSVDKIIEFRPYAYQRVYGQEREVKCLYELNGNTISFTFPEGFNPNIPVVIDPTVVAATLSGTSLNKNFGHTASYDNAGNIYVGARSFGIGYPTNSGSFQSNYGGGTTDIAVSKYNPTGSNLIYSTYIGGNDADLPHSIITDFDQQLYIYGTSASLNYPTTPNAFQRTYRDSIDIIITVLNKDGNALVGSTYVGGSNIDGTNTSEININYGDDFRGEIVLDGQRNVYIASVTSSHRFPVTNGAFDTSFNPIGNSLARAQDGVVFKLNSDLSVMQWSTYLGAEQSDAAMGLRVDDFGNVYVVGGAGSPNFPVTSGRVQSNWNGGIAEAFVVQLSADGSSMLNGTFWGSSGYELGYFIDIDEDDNVHIYGQTTGNMPITPNTYFREVNSRQFLSAFDKTLSTLIYSTVIGNGPNTPGGLYSDDFDFVPVAFMVDKCNNIYFSGYGAISGLPTTSDAISNIGNTFYLGVLDPNATALSFGTYYGLADHVDGGTSRFDKSGTVYQGVCSCTGSIMNTRSNAWATSQSTQCDIGVFKIDFDVETVTAFATALPATSGCAPFTVNFSYTGKDATSFQWDFGNGTSSTAENPIVTFQEAGSYNVVFVASNAETCNQKDTFNMVIDVFDGSSTLLDTTICSTTPALLVNATTTNAAYRWNDGTTNASKNITSPGVYWVEITLGGCSRLDSFIIDFAAPLDFSLGPDFSICDQVSSPIDASRADLVYYEWDDGTNDPIRIINTAGTYDLFVIDENGCNDRDTVAVDFGSTPFVELGQNDTLCAGSTQLLNATTPDVIYNWNTGATTPTISIDEPGTYWVEVSNNGCPYRDSIVMDFTEFNLSFDQADVACLGDCNGFSTAVITGNTAPYQYQWNTGNLSESEVDLCPGIYTLTITDDFNCVYENEIVIGEPPALDLDIAIVNVECADDQNGSISISATGGVGPYSYALNDPDDLQTNPVFDRLSGGDYEIFLQDLNGCTVTEIVNVYEPPLVTVYAGEDRTIKLGDETRLVGQVFPYFGQLLEWTPMDSLSNPLDLITTAQPTSTTLYNLSVTDTISGCVLADDVLVRVDKVREVYIPNAFSHNADGTNDYFYVFAGEGVRRVLRFKIFDRWGEVVFAAENVEPNTFKHGWDGTFKGQAMNPGVFVYFAEVEFIDNEVIFYEGDVTLLK
ncbi:MAG: gliding motility-associated C-terminal domain-containing protein [Bacteroidota bacterium]